MSSGAKWPDVNPMPPKMLRELERLYKAEKDAEFRAMEAFIKVVECWAASAKAGEK